MPDNKNIPMHEDMEMEDFDMMQNHMLPMHH